MDIMKAIQILENKYTSDVIKGLKLDLPAYSGNYKFYLASGLEVIVNIYTEKIIELNNG